MRMAGKGEDLKGKVCVNSIGRIAVVSGKGFIDFREAYLGMGFDGKGTWAASKPCVVAESVEEYREKLSTRFAGKMSNLG